MDDRVEPGGDLQANGVEPWLYLRNVFTLLAPLPADRLQPTFSPVFAYMFLRSYSGLLPVG